MGRRPDMRNHINFKLFKIINKYINLQYLFKVN